MDFWFLGTTRCERNPNLALALRSLYKEKTSGTPGTVERVPLHVISGTATGVPSTRTLVKIT